MVQIESKDNRSIYKPKPYLLMFPAYSQHITKSEFHTFEQCGFAGVTIDLSFKNGDAVLASLELSTVAQRRDFGQRFEPRACSVVLYTYGQTNGINKLVVLRTVDLASFLPSIGLFP